MYRHNKTTVMPLLNSLLAYSKEQTESVSKCRDITKYTNPFTGFVISLFEGAGEKSVSKCTNITKYSHSFNDFVIS